MNNDMSLAVNITGNADSVVAAADKASGAIAGFEGVSEGAIASLTAAIERLDIDFTKMGGTAVQSATHVRQVGESAVASKVMLEDFNRAGGAGARMFSALGSALGEAAGRVEAFTGVLGEMTAMAPEIIAIGAAIVAVGSAFEFFKEGVQDAAQLQQSMDQLRAVVDEQKGSWSAASEEIKKFIETESMASGISETRLSSAFAELAGKIHNIHDAMVIMRVAEEEAAATGKSLEEITNALLEAEAGRGQTLAQLDPRLKNLIHDHTDMHTILKVLHDDNRKALDDQNNANMSWARAKVALEVLGEQIGAKLLPVIQYLGEVVVGLIQVFEDWGKVLTDGFRGYVMVFVDSAGVLIHAATAVWDALHGNAKGAVAEWNKTGSSIKATWGDMTAGANVLNDALKALNDTLHMHAIGHSSVNEALYQHDHAMGDLGLINNGDVGFGTGKHGRASRAGKGAIPTLGASSAVIQYDDSIKMTTRDQNKFTQELYATGDALGKQILALDKSREANEAKNEDDRATYGMSVQQEIAYYQTRLANLDKFDADYLQKKTELENKIDDLQTQEYKKEYDQAKQAHDQQVTLIKDWADKGVTLFNTFFENGKAGFKSFADAFKKMLEDMLVALEKSELTKLLARIFNVDMSPNWSPNIGGSSVGAGSGGGALSFLSALGGASTTGAVAYDGSLANAYMAAGMSQSDAVSMASSVSSGGSKSAFGLGGIPFGKNIGGASVGSYLAAAAGGAMIGQTVFGGKGYADVGGAMGAAAALALAGPAGWAAIAAMTIGGALIGGGAGSLFGNHFDPANEPDIYQQDAWGQENADMTGGEWTANGKQYNPDSWTNQLTHNRGWNIVMENFVSKFRGKTGQLPQSLQSVFSNIEQLWGGASGQADFNHDGKDGYLDIGSGKRAKWSEFWSYVQQFGPQIAQLMDNYQPADMYTSNSGSATMSGTYTPSGSPYILHDFPDYGGGGAVPVSGGGGGTGPVYHPGPGNGPIIPPGTGTPDPGNGGPLGGGEGHNKPAAVVVNNFISGNVLTQDQLSHVTSQAIARNSQNGHALRMNLVGKG